MIGIYLFVLGIYGLTSPGRIDIIDGEARFDVAYSLVLRGQPIFRDPLIGPIESVPGRGGHGYSYYGAAASVIGAPLVWLGLQHAANIERAQFLFSLTSTILGAGIAPSLFLFYLELGVALRRAVFWTLVSSFATMVWPVSTSSFDNAQHAFFAIAALYCAYLSANRKSKALAVAGGLFAGAMILYQEYFLLIIPFLALATLEWKPEVAPEEPQKGAIERANAAITRALQSARDLVRRAWDSPGEERASCVRYVLFSAAAAAGLALALAYNDYRFGSPFDDGKLHVAGPPLLGDPLTGFLTLLVSPGKSVFLYSPTLVLAILGYQQLRRRAHELALAIAACCAVLILFLSCISYPGGDWCWGPRYLTPLLPCLALAFPFAKFKMRPKVILTVMVLGLLVQVLALSAENQRFFFDRGLNDFFWWENPGFYLTHSALFARVGEFASLFHGLPATARSFTPAPLPTYSLLGPPSSIPRSSAPVWIQNFEIFFLPRPWPLWMGYLEPSSRPINMGNWLAGLSSVTLLGASLVFLGFRTKERV